MPFKWKDERINDLRDHLDKAVSGIDGFDIELSDFDFFPPRVVFVDVVKNEALRTLYDRVSEQMRLLHVFNASHKDRGFHPHMTVAFRDLKRSVFPAARAHFEQLTYGASFRVDHIVLLRHDEGKWEQFNRFYFP